MVNIKFMVIKAKRDVAIIKANISVERARVENACERAKIDSSENNLVDILNPISYDFDNANEELRDAEYVLRCAERDERIETIREEHIAHELSLE